MFRVLSCKTMVLYNLIMTCFIYIYIYICNNDNDDKRETWFRKASLTTQWTSKDNCSKICWSITLMRNSIQAWGLDFLLQWFGTGFFLIWECDGRFVKYKLNERKVLNWIHAKVGGRNSCIMGGLFTIEVEMGWQTSIWWCLWLVGSRRYFRESYWDNHLTWRYSVVYFDSPLWGLFLFHLITW